MKQMKSGRSLTVVLTGTVVAALLVVSFVSFFYSSKFVTTTVIADDVKKLAHIFHDINEKCGIMSVDVAKSPINFLNVKSFAGSEVGSINLVHPEKWEGPYVQDNLSVQGIEYMLVRTKRGYFITPGEGVKLPNHAVIGKDIVFDENSDIQAMMSDPKQLQFDGRSLAAKISMQAEEQSDDIQEEMANIED